jgi:hypothetical protein
LQEVWGDDFLVERVLAAAATKEVRNLRIQLRDAQKKSAPSVGAADARGAGAVPASGPSEVAAAVRAEAASSFWRRLDAFVHDATEAHFAAGWHAGQLPLCDIRALLRQFADECPHTYESLLGMALSVWDLRPLNECAPWRTTEEITVLYMER